MVKEFLLKWWGATFFVIVLILVLCVAIAKADVPQRRLLAPPAATLDCWNELNAIRESMFQSSMGEALIARAIGANDQFTWFYSRAHYVRETSDLKPSVASCSDTNRRTLRIMAASWEYQYLLDQARLEKR